MPIPEKVLKYQEKPSYFPFIVKLIAFVLFIAIVSYTLAEDEVYVFCDINPGEWDSKVSEETLEQCTYIPWIDPRYVASSDNVAV